MAKVSQKNRSNTNGGNEDNGGGVVVVLKVDLHCEGCAGKVVKAVRSLEGVESVRIGDNELKKITVVGKLDPVELRQKVEEKTKKTVELMSPAIKKDNSGGDGEQKKQLKQRRREKTVAVKDEIKAKEVPATTAVLKVPLHCEGCIKRIHKLVGKTKGFIEMSVDKNKDLVTVKGRIDTKELTKALKDKLKRNVEIVMPKKQGGDCKKKGNGGGGGGSGEKKGNSGDDNVVEKKGGDGGGKGREYGGEGGKVEGHKMEYYGGQSEYLFAQYVYESGYMVNYVHAPQLFSDENPNACVVM